MSGVRYSIIPADAVVDERVSDLHLRILAIFGKASDSNGWLRANQSALARQMNRARETINRAIADLVEWGYLRKQARYSGNDGRQLINDYQVVMDRERPKFARSAQPEVVETVAPCDVEITPPCDVQITGGVTSGDHTLDTTPFLHLTMKRGARPQKAAGCRLPDDFAPDLDWAVSNGLQPQVALVEAAKFRDYWSAKAGRDAVKLDWAATWRNWVRRALESAPRRAGRPPPRSDNLADYLNRNFGSMEEFHGRDDPTGPTIEAGKAGGNAHGAAPALQLAPPDRR